MRRDVFPLTIVAAAVLSALSSLARADTRLDETVVTASRSEQTIFDAPGSIDSVNRERIEASGPQINISESLGLVPGINVANRNNYAQDLQISIRGFGSRAPFGVRGVRLMVDGLPQSLPDGQGQTSQFAASSTSRIEVLRGPLAALYGNASGGVIQAFTRDPSEKPEWTVTGYAGSDELYRSSIQYSETRGDYGLVFDYGALSSEGFRQYSAAERHHINTKLVKKGEGSKTTFILNALDQRKSEDPGSRTAAEFASAPYAANAGNLGFKAGKRFVQAITGVVHESGSQGRGLLTLRASLSSRDLDNPGRSDSLTSTATWILIDRIQHALGAEYQMPVSFSGVGGRLSFGFEVDQVKDARTAKTFQTDGTIANPLSRDEDNTASNMGIFARGDWFPSDNLSLTTGLRFSQVKLQVKDYLPAVSGDGSGSRSYTGASPVIGLVKHLGRDQNLFMNVGRSFETPTLNEILYTPVIGGTTSNSFYGLDPARSTQLEAGWKLRRANKGFLTASAFFIRTKDDIVPEYLSSFQASWQNVDTERKGLELGGQWLWSRNFSSAAGFTWIEATYSEGATIRTSSSASTSTVASRGNKLPNTPSDRTQVELRYRSSEMAKKNVPLFQSTLELISVGDIYVRSDNTEKTSRYNLANLSLSANKPLGQGFVTGYLRIDNLTDKLYAASTIGDQESQRYYEPGAPRNWLIGLKYSVAL